MSESAEVKFGEWIEQGFALFKNNAGVLILAGLIVVALSTISLGIVAGPLMIGICMVTLRLVDGGEAPAAGDVFQGFNQFLDGFLFFLILAGISIVLNVLLGVIPFAGILATYALMAFVIFAPFKMADEGLGFQDACKQSIETVKSNYWPFLGFSIVAGLIGSVGAFLCGIGMILTLPIQYCILAVAYRDVYGGAGGGDTVVEPVPDTHNSDVSAETQAAVTPEPETASESAADSPDPEETGETEGDDSKSS